MQEYIPFFQAEKRSIAEKLAKYFEYSGLETKIHFDQEKDAYILSVPSIKEKEAKKYYQAFYFVERDRIEREEMNNDTLGEYDESNILSASTDVEAHLNEANEEVASSKMEDSDLATVEDMGADNIDSSITKDHMSENPDLSEVLDNSNTQDTSEVQDAAEIQDVLELQDASEVQDATEPVSNDSTDSLSEKAMVKKLLSDSGSYVMKSEKYKDYIGTQSVFLIMGALGIIFVILNVLEILTFLYGAFPNLIMGALFVFFIYVGISTGKKAKKLKLELDEETKLTDNINEWLRTTVTEEFLTSISNSELSEELDYIKKTDTIRDMLINEFGDQNRDYLDRLIEEFYTDAFDASNDYVEKDL